MHKHPPIAESMLPRWIAERCEIGRCHFDQAGRLYDSWRHYARDHHAEAGSPAEFAAAMERRGYEVDRLNKGDRTKIRWGLRLRCPVLTGGGR